MPSRRSTLPALAAAGLIAGALTGCASTAGEQPSDDPSGMYGVEIDVEAGWLDGGRQIAILTHGSSTCAPVAGDVNLRDDGVLDVELLDPDTEVCTADLAPRATLVPVPDGVTPTGGLDVHVTFRDDGFGTTDIPPYTGGDVAEFTPSAGWLEDGMLALLTWGSSSCAPVVESVTGSESEVTVAFAELPATQPCTMDMAPRVALVPVAGVEASAATAVLTGGEFAEPVTVPIAD